MGGPPPICIHNRHRYNCVECKGAGICEHSKRKIRCKECGGKSICSHGTEKENCVPCCGASICEHGKRRRRCPTCNPNSKELCPCGKSIVGCEKCSTKCPCGKTPSRCKIHGGYQLCKAPLCETRGIKKYDGYCLPCCIHYCPEIQVSRNFKTKENDVISRILAKYPDFNWIADKKIQDGCSKRRPDLLLDLGSHVIIVEVDENKHTTYDCSCQNKRLMEISQDIGHRPVVFIRFNPDAYVNQEGTKMASCWRINGYGVLDVSKSKRDEWNGRINTLIQQLEYWINNIPHKTVEIVELFY